MVTIVIIVCITRECFALLARNKSLKLQLRHTQVTELGLSKKSSYYKITWTNQISRQ